MTQTRLRPATVTVAGLLLAGALLAPPPARALEPQGNEEAVIKACDLRLCSILVNRAPTGDDLKCTLTKTWARSTIKEAETSKLTWGFGDARCSVDVDVSRATLISAVTAEETKFRLPAHTANCVVEQDGKLEKVTAVLSPKITFRNGKAEQVWINLKSVEGPASIQMTVQTAAYLADKLGLFHKRMIKQINRYVGRHCPEALAVAAATKPPAAKSKAKDKIK
jgi:hypothetical protein